MSKVKCRSLVGQRPHSKQCDRILHEAISNLFTCTMAYEKSVESEVNRSLRIVVDRFTECGVKIPN